MLRYAIFALTAASVLSATALAGGKTDPGLNAYQRFQGGPPTTPPPPPVDKTKPKTAAEKRSAETAAALRAQEEANLLRRIAVCDKLKQIALEQGDTKLEEEAIRLEEKAATVFRQRTQTKTTAATPAQEARK